MDSIIITNTVGTFNSVLVNLMYIYIKLWVNYHDNCDVKQHYCDMRISVIARPNVNFISTILFSRITNPYTFAVIMSVPYQVCCTRDIHT